MKCLVLLLLCVHRGAGQGPSDIATMVRHDVQQMATDVHVALGLQTRPLPPTTGAPLPPGPIPPPTVVPVTTQAPVTTLALPTTTVFPTSSTKAPITTDWPSTSLLPPSSSTTAAPTPTMQPPVSTTTMAQSTSLAPPSSSTAQPTTTQAPRTTASVPTTTTAVPTTTAAVPTKTSAAIPTSTMAPTTTSAVTTSSAPTTTGQNTAPPGTCTSPATLTFSGTNGASVGVQGPFNFSGWTYDLGGSIPPTYPQAILDQSTSTQVIGVTASNGVLICKIAAAGTNAATNATFYGYTMVNTVVNQSAALVGYSFYTDVTFDTTWQPLQSISIVTTGSPATYSTELWEISYVILGVT